MKLLNLSEILGFEAPNFIEKLIRALTKIGLVVEHLPLDHICYRVESSQQYKELYNQLIMVADLLVEDSINGRLISTFRLREPIAAKGRSVDLIELPMPKEGSPYKLGFEHGEFVVGAETDLEEFASRYPDLEWDKSALSKKINCDIRVELEEKISAKFHHLPLDRVIEDEKLLKRKV